MLALEDEAGLPIGFQYVGTEYFFRFLAGGPAGAEGLGTDEGPPRPSFLAA